MKNTGKASIFYVKNTSLHRKNRHKTEILYYYGSASFFCALHIFFSCVRIISSLKRRI